MFGYVRAPLQTLPEEEAERYHRMYCGLCHTLARRYGLPARFVLNYDFTFLAILLSDGETERCSGRCIASPFHRRAFCDSDAALELAADESVILAYWQLRDGVSDHGWLRGLKYRSGAAALESAYRKAAAARPAFDAQTRAQLTALAKLEAANCPSLDAAADTFAALLSGAAGELDNPVRRRVLEQLLYHLGRWIYLVDAADDLREDTKTGGYNPVALRFGLTDGQWTPEARQAFAQTLDHSIHMIETAYELWEFGVWRPILESTFYSGLFGVGKAVLDGTFQTGRRGGRRETKRKVEEPV